jgi:hypothetical protein
MALPFPFYYEVFSKEGPVCGTILDRIQRKANPCHPSNFIYTRMFGEQGFKGAATAPAAVHIGGFALNGWPGALLELIIASCILGAFMSLPRHGGPMVSTFTVMGGLTGYYFSQLPLEGALVYDHGVLWWGLLVAAYSAWRWASDRSTG